MSLFDSIGLEDLEGVVFKAIKSIGGPDIEKEIGDRADALLASAEALEDVAVLLRAAYEALADKRLSLDEVKGLIGMSPDIKAAISAIAAAWADKENAGPGE